MVTNGSRLLAGGRRAMLGLAGLLAAVTLQAQPAAPGGRVPPPGPACQPGPGEVAVYADTFRHGACRVLKAGEHAGLQALGVGPRGPRSIQFGRGSRPFVAQMCGHDQRGQARCMSVTRDDDSLSLPGVEQIGWLRLVDRLASSERCEPRSEADDTRLMIEARVTAVGEDLLFCLRVPPGDYPEPASFGLAEPSRSGGPDPGEIDRWRQSARFVRAADVHRVRAGAKVRALVCSDRAFAGSCSPVNFSEQRYGKLMSLRITTAPPCTLAGDALAVVYAEAGGWGRCATLPAGEHLTIASLRLDGAVPRSLLPGPRTAAMACDEEHLMGRCSTPSPGRLVDRLQLHSLRLVPLPPAPAEPAGSAAPAAASRP